MNRALIYLIGIPAIAVGVVLYVVLVCRERYVTARPEWWAEPYGDL